VTPDPGLDVARVREQVGALAAKCRERNILFDYRPKVHEPLMDSYYTPGTKLNGRCLYPFLHARVSFSGKMYFCPFIRVEVGDLTTSSLDEVPGIGPSRKRALLMHFGTARAVKGAALEDLERAPGISRTIARQVYDHFHPAG